MKPVKTRLSKSAQRQAALGVTTKVLRLRIKDKHATYLLAQSREVNMVWNYSQDLALQVLQREHRFMSAYDMADYTKGAAKEGLSLHSQTIQAVSEEYCTRRRQFKKAKLRWRVSHGSKRSLGWIPVKAVALRYKNGQVHYQGVPISLWDSYGLKDYALRSGSFCEDARGRWYLNVTVDVKKPEASQGQGAMGIDLGLKDFANFSDGSKEKVQKIYRGAEEKLAVAQRAKTKMAKSVLDAGWSTFRTMLKYKCDNAAVWFDEVNESYSTQECSACHACTGPKGLVDLAVCHWACSACGAEHDRDTNAAKNILARGLILMQISIAAEARAVEAAMNKAAGA